jgi:predicted nucleic-acid-binding Zn-ribbon protein
MTHALAQTHPQRRDFLRFDYRCPKCRSASVCHDASAIWDASLQRFVLVDVNDHCSCNDCGHADDSGHSFFIKLEG